MAKPLKKTDFDKPWRKRSIARRTRFRPRLQHILIVCEGERTEPNYFNAICSIMPRNTVKIIIEGTGMNTISLVREAIRLRNECSKSDIVCDQTWVVFDKDDFPDGDFNTAITMCSQHKLNAAYSNQAFEIWYILHFEDRHTGMHRNEYKEKLSGYLDERYKKNDEMMYQKLQTKGNETEAIRRAKKLHEEASRPPSSANPCTTVYELVAELNKYKRIKDEE